MSWNEGSTKLRNELADLYPDNDDIKRLVDEAGLNLANIDFNGTPINVWHKVVKEAHTRQRLDKLIKIASNEYSENQYLREAAQKNWDLDSERDLFPAPPRFEDLDNVIEREQHNDLVSSILAASAPIIIHASGGVGKSVVARQLADSLPVGSLGIVYDCFGAGGYRIRSESRHHHNNALVQIANEIASRGFCNILVPHNTDLSALMRAFVERLRTAVTSLRKANAKAILMIMIDAADNAEMAAQDFGGGCFAHELLRENIPDGCRLVMLCRTERIDLLKPSSIIQQIELQPFNEHETLAHLQATYPDATNADGREFHRLTNGNPRVQANVLNANHKTIAEALSTLGRLGTTVEQQIESQLEHAINEVKDNFPDDFQEHINAVCYGLANLPPFIPIEVLAAIATVETSTIRSFIADLGQPLWLSDNFVQFRDEPTETWFREKYPASTEQIESYIKHLKPLAATFPYVAETLPYLLLQSGNYDQLVSLALSDDLLPEDSPIDKRNIRVSRLKFAFQAALRQEQLVDAIKLALRAGEEVAGDERQFTLLQQNVDLIAPLQSQYRVQELAFQRRLRSGWAGSEHVYTAALLSSVEDFKGEAQSYLRSAHNWLRVYFDEREKSESKTQEDALQDNDIVELVFAHYNLSGVHNVVEFIQSWKPPEVVFHITQQFTRRLVDAGKFEAIYEILQVDYLDQYLIIAMADELLTVGRFPPTDVIQSHLDLLADEKKLISEPTRFPDNNRITSAIVSFAEASAANSLPKTKILHMLDYYIPQKAPSWINGDYVTTERRVFLRAAALRAVLSDNFEPDIATLMPKKLLDKKDYQTAQDAEAFKKALGALLPWYIARAQVLTDKSCKIDVVIQTAKQRSKGGQLWSSSQPNKMAFEVSRIHFEILVLHQTPEASDLEAFVQTFIRDKRPFSLPDHLNAVRTAFRLDYLSQIRHKVEISCREKIAADLDTIPDQQAAWYISLARAVLSVDSDDAAVYFSKAIEVVSKFGDEAVDRWEAVVALAERSAEEGKASPKTAYRFIRCAELVGDNVVREKYFGRNRAMMACAKLHPTSAFAALSRWRDRHVGWFSSQLYALAYEVVSSGIVSASVGWSLSAFFDFDRSNFSKNLQDFASLCIERASNPKARQYIFDKAVRDLRLGETSKSSWQALNNTAQEFGLSSDELQDALTFYAEQPEAISEPTVRRSLSKSHQQESEFINWEQVFDGLDLTAAEEISKAIKRFKDTPKSRLDMSEFWGETFKRVAESDVSKFLEAAIKAENIDLYDIQLMLADFPGRWREKVSIINRWSQILEAVAKRFAHELTNRYTLELFLNRLSIEPEFIYKSIIAGLSESGDISIADVTTFFGFVPIASPYISPQEAATLLDFALSRFEEHIENDYADGPWAEWLQLPEDVTKGFTGLVWAALGSPRTAMRWRAAHCVRRLAEAGCQAEIDALIQWMNQNDVGAFGSDKFPFYNLHARQYLLIALARVSIDQSQILRQHYATFLQYALRDRPHILIQKYSAQVALNIEARFPGTYEPDIIEQLNQIGTSQHPIKQTDKYSEKFETPWHMRGEVDDNLKFHLAYDFDRYWFEPLGKIFGVSSRQIEELARQIIVKEWDIEADGSYASDPRVNLWESSRWESKVWHTHFDYLRTHGYSFYLSYHAMLSIAARLLDEMPIVHRQEWHDYDDEDEWAEWLQRHTLTRPDGRWLADRRDPAPLAQRAWLRKGYSEQWLEEIADADFLEGLLHERYSETWLNVFGDWSDSADWRKESFNISSALVLPSTSQSLLNALNTCLNPHSFRLPRHEDDMEFEVLPFELKGWIWDKHPSKYLDRFDPHAADIDYPPYEIGETIIQLLGLSSDLEQREWHLPNIDNPSLICEIWSVDAENIREYKPREGKRISASLTFLKQLCASLKRELVIAVKIERRLDRQSTTWRDNDTKQISQVYILSADGGLRDSRTYYQLRESTG